MATYITEKELELARRVAAEVIRSHAESKRASQIIAAMTFQHAGPLNEQLHAFALVDLELSKEVSKAVNDAIMTKRGY